MIESLLIGSLTELFDTIALISMSAFTGLSWCYFIRIVSNRSSATRRSVLLRYVTCYNILCFHHNSYSGFADINFFVLDIFWVFGTDVMMTVATKVEAPVKFIYTAPPSDTPKPYPFSVLGLGDVVIPGLFVRLTQNIDEVLQPKNLSYFNVAVAAYAAGLALCFGANEIFHNGQPALLYLDPSLVGSTLACAALNDQVPQLWDFKEEEEVESSSSSSFPF